MRKMFLMSFILLMGQLIAIDLQDVTVGQNWTNEGFTATVQDGNEDTGEYTVSVADEDGTTTNYTFNKSDNTFSYTSSDGKVVNYNATTGNTTAKAPTGYSKPVSVETAFKPIKASLGHNTK